ncbi:MAG: DUF6020 family protein [Olsenella sp.]|nr:DUF6020 family protein [Olsenella sp.]
MRRELTARRRDLRVPAFAVAAALVGVAVSTSYSPDGTVLVSPFDLPSELAVLLALPLLWRALFGAPGEGAGGAGRSRLTPWSCVTSAVLALTVFLGRPIDEGGMLRFRSVVFASGMEAYELPGTAGFLVWSLLVLAGDLVLCWCLVRLAFDGLRALAARSRSAVAEKDVAPDGPAAIHGSAAAEAADGSLAGARRALGPLTIALVLLLAWLPYLVAWFPGTVTSDQSIQLAQFFGYAGHTMDTHYPFFVAVVFGNLYRLGTLVDPSGWTGILLMTLVQLACALLSLTEVCLWVERLRGRGRAFHLALAFCALFPLIPVYVVSIGKDGVHAFLVALLCLQLYLAATVGRGEAAGPGVRLGADGHVEGSWLFSPWALLANGVLVSLTRNNGVFLVGFGLLVLLLLTRRREVAATLAATLAAFACWTYAVVPACGVEVLGPAEALSLPMQVVAANLHADAELDAGSREVLERSFSVPLDEVAGLYNPLVSDPVKNHVVVGEKDAASVGEFCSVALGLAREHPLTSFVAAARTTMSVYPFTLGTYYLEDKPYFNSPDDAHAALGWFASVDEIPEHVARPLAVAGTTLLKVARTTLPLSILYTPGTYFWLLVVLLGFALDEGRLRGATFCAVSPLVMLETVLVAAPCGSVRYALPLAYSLPLLMLLATDVACAGARAEGARHLRSGAQGAGTADEKAPTRGPQHGSD